AEKVHLRSLVDVDDPARPLPDSPLEPLEGAVTVAEARVEVRNRHWRDISRPRHGNQTVENPPRGRSVPGARIGLGNSRLRAPVIRHLLNRSAVFRERLLVPAGYHVRPPETAVTRPAHGTQL